VDFFGVCVLYSVRDVILVVSTWPSAAFLHFRYMQLTATLPTDHMLAVYSGWKSVDNYDTCASVF
jgi:hypothetical protein